MKFCLSIDGGGIRGILPAMVLEKLENVAGGKRTYEMFDLIGGTSTGAIIAAGVGGGLWAEDLVSLYELEGPRIFKTSRWRKIKGVWGLRGPRYDNAALMSILQRTLGTSMLSDSLTNIMITAYDLQNGGVEFFKSYKAKVNENRNFPIWEVAGASASAPTYFKPIVNGNRRWIDGGVFSNNPTMCVWTEARKLWPDEDIFILSLGTSSSVTGYSNSKHSDKWGLIQWAKKMATIFMDGASDQDIYHVTKLNEGKFIRLSPRFSCSMDDASRENIRDMKDYFRTEYNDEIDGILRFVVEVMIGNGTL